MRALILTISLLVGFSSTAFAQGVGYFTTGNQSPNDKRTMRICVGGDIQNLVSMDPATETSTITPSMASCQPGQAGTCSGPYCTKSPYCDQSWYKTGNRILRNMTYSMIGRSDLMDYAGIAGGVDVDYSHTYNRKHEACDLVLVVGDLQDSGDSDTNPPREMDNLEWNNVIANHLDILDAAGVPWMATNGNHDNIYKYIEVVDTKLQASPYFYNRATDGLSHAILIPTKLGNRVCVLGIRGIAANGAADAAFLLNNRGCGGGFPTIVMSHYLVDETTCNSVGDGLSTADDAGYEMIFLGVAGHATPTAPFSLCASSMSPGGTWGTAKIYLSNVNTQELDRHGYSTTVNAPYGNTVSDSEGGVYEVITIDPVLKTIDMSIWNPYTQSSANGSGYTFTPFHETFDWDARFPP